MAFALDYVLVISSLQENPSLRTTIHRENPCSEKSAEKHGRSIRQKRIEHHEKSMKEGSERLHKQFTNEVIPPECKKKGILEIHEHIGWPLRH